MEYTQLGNTGITVSRLCLGTIEFGRKVDKEQAYKILDLAFDNGLVFWDTADMYGREDPLLNWKNTSGRSEEIIGNWIADSGSRDNLVISTKSRWPPRFSINYEGLSRKHLLRSVKQSLDRLRTEYIDLYFAHGDDKHTKVKDVIHTYNMLINQSKIHNYGLSNFQHYRIMKYLLEARYNGMIEPTVLQYPYSLTERYLYEIEIPNLIQDEELGMMAYAPLNGGFLAGEYGKDEIQQAQETNRRVAEKLQDYEDKPHKWAVLDELKEIATELELKPSQIAQSWVLSQDTVDSIVIGVSKVEQLVDALEVFSISLDEDHIRRLNEVSEVADQIPWWTKMYTDNYLDWVDNTIRQPVEEGKYTVREILFD